MLLYRNWTQRRIERKLKKIKAKKLAATETLGTSKDIEHEITEDLSSFWR